MDETFKESKMHNNLCRIFINSFGGELNNEKISGCTPDILWNDAWVEIYTPYSMKIDSDRLRRKLVQYQKKANKIILVVPVEYFEQFLKYLGKVANTIFNSEGNDLIRADNKTTFVLFAAGSVPIEMVGL